MYILDHHLTDFLVFEFSRGLAPALAVKRRGLNTASYGGRAQPPVKRYLFVTLLNCYIVILNVVKDLYPIVIPAKAGIQSLVNFKSKIQNYNFQINYNTQNSK